MGRIDRSRAFIKKKGFQFQPFRPPAERGIPLRDARLAADQELLVFERNGQRRVLIMREMAYHHVAQGVLAGEPYLVSDRYAIAGLV